MPGRRKLAVSLTALCALACATNPATGRRQLMLVSEQQEIAMGREADQQIPAVFGLYQDDALSDYVAELGLRMAGRSERPALPWKFGVVDDPAVNAFALPGGFIYVTRGILAHFGSEAQLAAVLGHEIGHVTARHSANQMSRAQLGMLGLGIGMIAKPEWAERYSELAQAGLSLLFLKFGRDQEREADDLGLRYLSQVDYDAREMVAVFRMLERAGGGSERLPEWLSTHPAPEDREQRIAAQLASLPAGGSVRQTEYLRRLDGLVFGDDPREGYFSGGAFLHPELRFRLELPQGWRRFNERRAVSAQSPEQDAVVQLTLASGSDAQAALREFLGQSGIQALDSRVTRVHGLSAVEALFEARSGQAELRGQALFIEYDERVYRLLGFAAAARFAARREALTASLASFDRLTDRRALEVQPLRLVLRRLMADKTPRELAQERSTPVTPELLGQINQVGPDQPLRRGTLVKLVSGELPP